MKRAAFLLLSLAMLSTLALTGCENSPAPSPAATPNSKGITVKEETVVIGEGTEYELEGTLSIPEGAKAPYPAVVLVHGSGPSDRDETIYANKPFRDIADYLSSKGIAVLRYDKRTYTHQMKMAKMIQEITVREETIEDAINASKLLKADERIDKDRVYIIGHSLGGMLAPRIDAEGGDFAGLIIMAGSPRTFAEIMADQIRAAIDQLSEEERAAAQDRIKGLEELIELLGRLDTMSDEEAKSINISGGASGYYFKEMAAHPASAYLANIEKPVLILQGGKDFQVYPDKDYVEYQSLLSGKPNVTFKLYPELNHLFMTSTTGDATEYLSPGKVDSEVLEDIAEWILSVNK